jgi:hypothetical protein
MKTKSMKRTRWHRQKIKIERIFSKTFDKQCNCWEILTRHSANNVEQNAPLIFCLNSLSFFFHQFHKKVAIHSYAFCSALMRYYMRCYSTYFARNATRKIRIQEIKFCRLAVLCASHARIISSQFGSKSFFFEINFSKT